MNSKYIPSDLEPKWQKHWDNEKAYLTRTEKAGTNKKYVLDMFPYPSGAGLHVGHPLGYIASDIYSRYLRLKGHNVLHPMGWDAFGLPAENYAIKTGAHPKETTQKNIAIFKHQLKRLGLSYDWEKEIDTSSPDYYKWTQWLFLKLYENGLAYRKKAPVNWCSSCQTVLANEQVKNGKCERCRHEVIQKNMEQWFFKITDYADQLLTDLDKLDWPESIKSMQRNWIGKSAGAEIEFKILNSELRIKVFTTRPDTLFGATYLVIAPECDAISNIKNQISNIKEIENYIESTKKKTDIQRTDLNKEKTGVELKGVKAINPVNKKEIPIWIADYVLNTYGTGAIMAVPAHDLRDWEFAKKFNLPIEFVIQNSKIKNNKNRLNIKNSQAFIKYGNLVNSGKYSGMTSETGGIKIVKDLRAIGLSEFKTQYKFRDWLISRQRYWGAPIPIIYCRKCLDNSKLKTQKLKLSKTTLNNIEYAIVPVPENQLPVELPTDVDFKPTGESPLVNSKTFHTVNCPNCHSSAIRESDTMDTFVDSSWYYLAYIMRGISNFQFPITNYKNEFAKWMPVDVYVGGAEHAVMHLLYARFITKVLNQLEYIDAKEPFLKLKNQGLILAEDGKKMSKSLGNVINPDDIVNKFGADSFRLYEMFMGPLEDTKPWSTGSIMGVYRFLEKVWKIGNPSFITDKPDIKICNSFNKLLSKINNDIESFSFNTAISAFMIFVNEITQKGIAKELWQDFLIILSPFAPHVCEELWSISGMNSSILNEKWVDYKKISSANKQFIQVQINNKFRGVIDIDSDDASEEDIMDNIKKDKQLNQYLSNNNKIIRYITGEKIIIMVE